jgi:hypothetical protein
MRLLLCRLAAAFTLVALVACSGLGVCWKQFARAKHHCCPGGDSDTTRTSLKPCASVVSHEAAVVVPPPPVATLPVTLEPAGLADGWSAAGPIVPGKSPPLVLRV